MSNGKIIVQVGQVQRTFNDRGFYSKVDCDLIESIVSCNKAKLAQHGGNGRIRINDESGNMKVQLSVVKDNSFISNEDDAVIVISFDGSMAYTGKGSDLEFDSSVDEWVTNDVSFYRNMLKSWKVVKGNVSAIIVIIDNKTIYDKVVVDEFFKDCYVLLAE